MPRFTIELTEDELLDLRSGVWGPDLNTMDFEYDYETVEGYSSGRAAVSEYLHSRLETWVGEECPFDCDSCRA